MGQHSIGVNTLFSISQVLGHADTRVTKRYAHLSSKTLQDAANSASLKIKEAICLAKATTWKGAME